MPFENIKRQLDLQKQAKDAELKHQQWLEEQQRLQRQSIEAQKQEAQRQKQEIEKERINKLTECFNSSHINELTDDLLKVVPGMYKNQEIHRSSVYIGENSFLFDVFEKKVKKSIPMYRFIKLKWDSERGCSEWINKEINIGFSLDKSLIIEGKQVTILSENEWCNSQLATEKAIEKAFNNPIIYHDQSERPPPSYYTEIFFDGR